MKYFLIFHRFFERRNVFYQILRSGYISGEHPDACLKIVKSIDGVYSPEGRLVLDVDIVNAIIRSGVASQECFKRFARVEFYDVDIFNYPKKLEKYVTRDDIEERTWKALGVESVNEREIFEYDPPVLTYPQMRQYAGFCERSFRYFIKYEGDVVAQNGTIGFAPELIEFPNCYWMSGAYVVSEPFASVVRDLLPVDIWDIIEFDVRQV